MGPMFCSFPFTSEPMTDKEFRFYRHVFWLCVGIFVLNTLTAISINTMYFKIEKPIVQIQQAIERMEQERQKMCPK